MTEIANIKILNISNKKINNELDLSQYHDIIKLHCSNNNITSLILPRNLEILNCVNNPLSRLEFGMKFNKLIITYDEKKHYISIYNIFSNYCYLPNTITYLKFGSHYNQDISNLPDTIEYLFLGINFNQEINKLPNNLTHLHFDFLSVFNNSLHNLRHCSKLSHLELHKNYELSLNLSSTTLKYLTLGSKYNQEIILPHNLISLKTGYSFNQKLDNLPQTLNYLYLNLMYEQEINTLPENIILIEFTSNSNFNKTIDHLPNRLQHLRLCSNFNHKINNLPNTLTYLELGTDFNHNLDNLPNSLIVLKLDYSFDNPLDNLPSSLQCLLIYGKYNRPLNNLPFNLKILRTSNNFNNSLSYLPDSITHILLGYQFDKQIIKLPTMIEEVIIPNNNYKRLFDYKLLKYAKIKNNQDIQHHLREIINYYYDFVE